MLAWIVFHHYCHPSNNCVEFMKIYQNLAKYHIISILHHTIRHSLAFNRTFWPITIENITTSMQYEKFVALRFG